MIYRNKIILILISNFVIFACSNNTVTERYVFSNETEEKLVNITENSDKQDSVPNYKFSINPIDSLMRTLYSFDFAEIQVTQMDTIEQDPDLLGMFSEKKGLESIFYKTPKTDNDFGIKYALRNAFMTQLNFNNANNAQNSFSIFVKELFGRSNFYIWYLKAGAICFIEGNSIYKIRVNTCPNTKDMERFEKVIREQVFNNAKFKGVKVYCGLQNPQML